MTLQSMGITSGREDKKLPQQEMDAAYAESVLNTDLSALDNQAALALEGSAYCRMYGLTSPKLLLVKLPLSEEVGPDNKTGLAVVPIAYTGNNINIDKIVAIVGDGEIVIGRITQRAPYQGLEEVAEFDISNDWSIEYKKLSSGGKLSIGPQVSGDCFEANMQDTTPEHRQAIANFIMGCNSQDKQGNPLVLTTISEPTRAN